MTIIAFDGYDFVADSQTTSDDVVGGWFNKLWRWDHGWFSVAGKVGHYPQLRAWLDAGKNLDKKPKIKGKYHALVWNEDEQIMYECWGNTGLIPAPCPVAAGSGHQVALGVMLMGKSAVKAVKTACVTNIYCGGPIQKVSLRKKADGKYTPCYSGLAQQSLVQQQTV